MMRNINIFLAGVLTGLLISPMRARADEPPMEIRAGMGFDILHAQGYWSPSVRVGNEWGLRAGLLKAPAWAGDVPEEIKQEKPQFDLKDVGYFGVDREWCGARWCGSLGLVHLTRLTEINGTHWNFMIGIRYKFSPEWSGGIVHFSHASMLGIQKDRANSGWNILGAERTWR